MKYIGVPMGMWVLFAKSFRRQLTEVLRYDADTARSITKKAKPKYKKIIAELPEFEKADRFKMNIVNSAMLGAFILSMPHQFGYNKKAHMIHFAVYIPACAVVAGLCTLFGGV